MNEQLIQAFNILASLCCEFGAQVIAPDNIEASPVGQALQRITTGEGTQDDIDRCRVVYTAVIARSDSGDAGIFQKTLDAIDRAELIMIIDAITIVECATQFGITTQAVSQAIDAGRLRGYRDPDAPQRQGARKISRGEAATLWGK